MLKEKAPRPKKKQKQINKKQNQSDNNKVSIRHSCNLLKISVEKVEDITPINFDCFSNV